jgi:hypothetical protein
MLMRRRAGPISLFGSLCRAVALTLLAGCSTLAGYPSNFQDNDAVLGADKPFLAADVRANGDAPLDSQRGGLTQRQYRDTVVYRRIEVIDIHYYDFESKLTGSYNGLDAGADLTGLILSGFGATTGNAATKAALAAASAGVIGAKATVNTDIFYQKTLPALVSEMRAGRQAALATIKTGLTLPVTQYSIDQALDDINSYYIAGTLPSAVAQVTAQAGVVLAKANDAIAALRTTNYVSTTTTKRIIAWLFPNGDATKPPIPANLARLTQWMSNDTVDPALNGAPYILLLNANFAQAEADRSRAIAALGIP